MARHCRSQVFVPDEIAIVHVMNRIARKAFLFGEDSISSKDFSYRKKWIKELVELFAAHFGIDLCHFAILSNHFHFIFRSRPDIVACMSDFEVARRWLNICPVKKDKLGVPIPPTVHQINAETQDPERIAELRNRLSDISWWMRLLSQRVASRANREDGQTGRFFQGRFKAVRLESEEAILACSAYVDLNIIRAAMADTLIDSYFSSIQNRIAALLGEEEADCSLARFTMEERLSSNPSESPRCSDDGLHCISLEDYIELLEWTVGLLRQKDTIEPNRNYPAVIDRLGLGIQEWCDLANNYCRLAPSPTKATIGPRSINGRKSRNGEDDESVGCPC